MTTTLRCMVHTPFLEIDIQGEATAMTTFSNSPSPSKNQQSRAFRTKSENFPLQIENALKTVVVDGSKRCKENLDIL